MKEFLHIFTASELPSKGVDKVDGVNYIKSTNTRNHVGLPNTAGPIKTFFLEH